MGGHWYFDKGGVKRAKARVAWWREDALTLRDGAVIPDGTQLHDADDKPVDSLPTTALPDEFPATPASHQ